MDRVVLVCDRIAPSSYNVNSECRTSSSFSAPAVFCTPTHVGNSASQLSYQLPFNSAYYFLTLHLFSEDENEFIHIFRHHDYSHRMHLNFTFLWLYFLFSSEKSRFRLSTLRPSSFGLFWVYLQSRAPVKRKKSKFSTKNYRIHSYFHEIVHSNEPGNSPKFCEVIRKTADAYSSRFVQM